MNYLKERVNNLEIIVFDLDYTLWPFWVDTHVCPPFKIDGNGKVSDYYGYSVKYYPEVPEVIKTLKDLGYSLGIASRTGAIEEAEQLLTLFNWKQYFEYKQIYPGCKVTHFHEIRKETGIPWNQMLFFDDEMRNIRDLSSKGVKSILVDKGVNKKVVNDGIHKFVEQNK